VRIGFTRFNQPLELDLNIASPHGAGCEIRSSFLVDLVAQGHEVFLLQYVPPQHRIWERGSLLGTSKREEMLRQLNYVPITSRDHYPVSRLDLDVLVIECGPTNTRYDFTENGVTMPFIRRTFLALRDYEGDVVYYQHDIDLPIPFGECLRNVSDEYVRTLADINLTRMARELGGEKLFFGEKRWIILHNALREWFVLEWCSRESRYSYLTFFMEGLIKLRYIPQLLVSQFDIEELGMQPRDSPPYDLMYVGSQKDEFRTRLLLRYYDSEKLRSCLIGKWRDRPWRHIEYQGVRGRQGDTIRYYNSAYATVFVPTRYMAEGGILTSRITQALLGGCAVFIHSDIYGIDKMVPSSIRDLTLVSSRSDVEEKVELLKRGGREMREFIVELQRRHLLGRYCDYNWQSILRW